MDSSPSEWPALSQRLGLRKWAEAIYGAFQAYICYMTGFGAGRDIACAGRYLAASSMAGFANAISISILFHKRYPGVEMPHWTPDLDGLFHLVLSGPRLGLPQHLSEMHLLRQLAPDLAAKAVQQMHTSVFSELGEDHVGDREHNEESLLGPDIQYQWFAQGSMALFQRILSSCQPKELIQGFKSGLFPIDGRNYNHETALYMCCRIGAADALFAMMKEFLWFRNQVSVATLDNRVPMHFLHSFQTTEFEQVAEILLENEANVNAVDSFGFRPVDYAMCANREEVVSYLISRREFKLMLTELQKLTGSIFRTATLHSEITG